MHVHRVLAARPHRRLPAPVTLGIMASTALLLAWAFVSRLGGLDRPAAWLLLEFVLVFVVSTGALVVAGIGTGLLGRPRARRRGREA